MQKSLVHLSGVLRGKSGKWFLFRAPYVLMNVNTTCKICVQPEGIGFRTEKKSDSYAK